MASDASIKARHCKELVRTGPSLAEMVPALSLIGERLTRVLSSALAQISGGEPPIVRAGMPMDTTLGGIQSELEGLAAHSLMTVGPEARPMLVTFEAAPVFRLVDRAFGGRGAVPDPLPDVFPLSADLLLTRIEQALSGALTVALGGADGHRVTPRRRETSLRQLNPFPMGEDLLQLSIEVEEAGADPWSLSVAFPTTTLGAVIAVPRHPAKARRTPGAADPAAEPFASMPLPVTAVLIDMALPFSRLATLRPGDVLPVAVARAVPLQVGGRTFATGAVGEVEDRIALQVGTAF